MGVEVPWSPLYICGLHIQGFSQAWSVNIMHNPWLAESADVEFPDTRHYLYSYISPVFYFLLQSVNAVFGAYGFVSFPLSWKLPPSYLLNSRK